MPRAKGARILTLRYIKKEILDEFLSNPGNRVEWLDTAIFCWKESKYLLAAGDPFYDFSGHKVPINTGEYYISVNGFNLETYSRKYAFSRESGFTLAS